MKRIQALIAAFIVTALVGFGMLAIGVSAALNPNSAPVSDSPDSPALAVGVADASAQSNSSNDPIAQYQAQIAQLNNLIAQYQNREKQYQAQLNQAQTQAQQLQAILDELQSRGIIRIQSDGTILLRGGR